MDRQSPEADFLHLSVAEVQSTFASRSNSELAENLVQMSQGLTGLPGSSGGCTYTGDMSMTAPGVGGSMGCHTLMEESSEQLMSTFCIPQKLLNTETSLQLTAVILF